MKLLGWIFNVKSRHNRGIRKYERSGTGYKLATLITSLALVGGAIALEWWFCSFLHNWINGADYELPVLSLIGIAILCVAVAGYGIEHCAVYSYTAFKMAIYGAVFSAGYRAGKNDVDDSPFEELNGEPALQESKALDIVLGIINAILAVGIIVGMVAFLILYVANNPI